MLETLTQWMNASRKEREAGVQACLQRIQEMDAAIRAWVQVAPQKPTGDGKLAGIPFGAKDIIETHGLATEYGSPVYKGRIGTEDAPIIREMRQRGAILLGKTVTTPFSLRTPGPTRNPRNLEYSPGGSSSGSAAAVAAGMVPFTIGAQTHGSVVRPASYCGVTGFKTSFGLYSVEGVLPLAPSFDTLGFYTHTPSNMLLLWEALGNAVGSAENFSLGIPERLPEMEPVMSAAFGKALDTLRRAAVSVEPIEMGDMLEKLHLANLTVIAYEAAQFHQQRYEEFGAKLGEMATVIEEGRKVPRAHYEETLEYIVQCERKIAELLKTTPVILMPAASGPAPRYGSNGEGRMNSSWTTLGSPAISISMSGVSGLPLGLQLTADHGQDAQVLQAAVRVYKILHASEQAVRQ